MKKILIVGSDSYIGTNLSIYLSKFKKYKISCIDIGFNNNCTFKKKEKLHYSKKIDLRIISESYLIKFDTVIFLAGLSLFLINDIKSIKEKDAYKITEKYTKNFILLCKKLNVKFIFPSSCSVYGIANKNEFVNELSSPNPITHYSKNKIIIEEFLKKISNKQFNPVILRLATAFGFSERMRFDIVVNMFVAMALTSGEIVLNSNGQAYRPFVEIKDICRAFETSIKIIDTNSKVEIYNVGSNKNNYKIIDIAKLIANIIPKTKIKHIGDNVKVNTRLFKDNKVAKGGNDKRNYRVSFDKIARDFDGFNKLSTLESGIKQMIVQLKKRNISINDFNNIKFHRLKQLNYLIEKGKVDTKLKLVI